VDTKTSTKKNHEGKVVQATTVVTEQTVITSSGKQIIIIVETTTVDDVKPEEITCQASVAPVCPSAVTQDTTVVQEDVTIEAAPEVEEEVVEAEASASVTHQETTTTVTTTEVTGVQADLTQEDLDAIHVATAQPITNETAIHVEDISVVRTGINTTKEASDQEVVGTLHVETETSTESQHVCEVCPKVATSSTLARPAWMTVDQWHAFQTETADWELEMKELALDAANSRAAQEL